jgi:hypothetical protein
MVAITQPQYNLLFSNPSNAELQLRQGLLNETAARRQQDQEQFMLTRADNQAAQQAAGAAAAPGLQMDNMKKAMELEQMQPAFEADMALKQAQTANTYASADKTQSESLQSKVGFIANKLGKVKDKAQLVRFNRMMQKMGILSEDKLPQTVEDAQMMWVGSEMNKMQEEYNNRISELDRKHQQGMISDDRKQQLEYFYTSKIENEKHKLMTQRAEKQFGQNFILGMQKNMRGPMIVNNIGGEQQDTGAFEQAEAMNAEPRAMGGPVNAGQPYLVGEQGPEVIVPQQSGNVIPNNGLQTLYQNPNGGMMQMGGDPSATQMAYSTQAQMRGEVPSAPLEQSADMDPNMAPDMDPMAKMAYEMAQQPGFGQANNQAADLQKATKSGLEKDLVDLRDTSQRALAIMDNFDTNLFTDITKAKLWGASLMDRYNATSDNQKDLIFKAKTQQQQIDQMFLMYRKAMTGTAGGEKEMEEIKKATLNNEGGPTESRAALYNLFLQTTSSAMTKQQLLDQGIQDPSTVGKPGTKAWSNMFYDTRLDVRSKIESRIEARMKAAKEAGLNMDPLDALRAELRFERQGAGQ